MAEKAWRGNAEFSKRQELFTAGIAKVAEESFF
jgi:hypothetical protein